MVVKTNTVLEDKQAKATESRVSGLEEYQAERFKYPQQCKRCGGKWKSETKEGPDACRWCNSPYWKEKPENLPASKSALKNKKSYSAVAIYVEDLLGLKKYATEHGFKSVSSCMEAVLLKQGIPRVTPQQYEEYKKQRKAAGQFVIK